MFVEDVNRPNSHVLQDAPLVLAVFCTFAIITKNAINYILNPACSVLNRYFPTAIQKEQMALDFGEFSLSQKNNLTTKVLAIDKKKTNSSPAVFCPPIISRKNTDIQIIK